MPSTLRSPAILLRLFPETNKCVASSEPVDGPGRALKRRRAPAASQRTVKLLKAPNTAPSAWLRLAVLCRRKT
jgi:hypothetical protein